MPRATPPDRIERLIDVATRVFVEQGYRRTQMADVADALGVAKGTLYLYVESKEALFDLVLRSADAPRPLPIPGPLPVRTPRRGATLAFVRKRLASAGGLDALQAALACNRVADARAELRQISEEIYDVLARNRRGIEVIDRSARDHPQLAALWFEGSRMGLVGLLARYLEDRIARRTLRPVPDALAAARLIVETLAWWAVQRHWDSHPQAIPEDVAKATAVTFLVHALGKDT